MIKVRCPDCQEIYAGGTDHKCKMVAKVKPRIPYVPPIPVERDKEMQQLDKMLAEAPPKFDRNAYQRELMRKRRAKDK